MLSKCTSGKRRAIKCAVFVGFCLAAAHVRATPESLEIGVVNQYLVLDATGRYAAVFGQPVTENFGSTGRIIGPPTKVVVVDLQEQAITNEAEVAGDIREAFIDSDQVIWLTRNVNVLNRLPLTGGEALQQRPLAFAVDVIHEISANELALVITQGKISSLKVLDRSTLEDIPDHALSTISLNANQVRNHIVDLGDGLFCAGHFVINKDDGTLRCLASNMYYRPKLTIDTNPPQPPMNGAYGQYAWRRYINGKGVTKHDRQLIFQINSGSAVVSKTLPLIAESEMKANEGKAELLVTLKDLVYGRNVGVMSFDPKIDFRAGYHTRRWHLSPKSVQTAGTRVVVALNELLFWKTIPEVVRESASKVEPLRLVYPSLPLTDVGEKLVVQLKALGGTPPYKFNVMPEADGLRVDDTGSLVVDLPQLWRNRLNPTPPQTGYDISNWLKRGHAPESKEWFGFDIPPGKFTVAVPLHLRVSDNSGQDDAIVVSVMATASIAELKVAQAKIQTEMESARELAIGERQAAASDNRQDILQRVERLEQSMRRIEAALDTMLKKTREENDE